MYEKRNIETKAKEGVRVQEGSEKKDCCRIALGSGAAFCPKCGTAVVPEQKQESKQQPGPTESVAKPAAQEPTDPVVSGAEAAESGTAGGKAKCSCGEPIDPKAKFCCSCGNKAVLANPNPAAENNVAGSNVKCSCGEAVDSNAKFCPSCGHKFAGPGPRYKVVCKSRDGFEKTAEFLSDVFVIGKNAECDLAITHDECVSRRHAKITVADGQIMLEDDGSLNGTFVQLTGPIPLSVGDTILIGANYISLEEI